jgi:hypothetical protein
MKSFLYISILFVFSGCCPKVGENIHSSNNSASVDSLSVVERLVPQPVYIPGDTVIVSIPFDCDSAKRNLINTSSKRASLNVTYDNGVLNITSGCKSLVDSINAKELIIKKLSTRTDSASYVKHEVRSIPFIPKLYKWAMWYTVVSIISLIIYIIFKILKIYYKWQIPLI